MVGDLRQAKDMKQFLINIWTIFALAFVIFVLGLWNYSAYTCEYVYMRDCADYRGFVFITIDGFVIWLIWFCWLMRDVP